MPVWPQPNSPAAERVRDLHATIAGVAAHGVATAPATWAMVGEHTDAFGGVTVMGQAGLRAAAAVSPRDDDTIAVHISAATADGGEQVIKHSTTLDALGELSAAQSPTTDEEGQPVNPPAPTGGLGQRAAGIVWMMVNRQLLSRETGGMDLTVVCDIPLHAGLGAESAIDVALALALLPDSEDPTEAPLRARLAEVCHQAGTLFSLVPPLRARHTTALRGKGTALTVIDYADNSVTHATHPLGKDLAGIVIAAPSAADVSAGVAALHERGQFIADALHAFGADNLRLLPDAEIRVPEWLTAVHEVYGPKNQPTVAEARRWLAYLDAETDRAEELTQALRSRRDIELVPLVHASQEDMTANYGLTTAEELAAQARERGALGARAASAGITNAVIAYVPATQAAAFVDAFAADGYDIIVLDEGQPAELED